MLKNATGDQTSSSASVERGVLDITAALAAELGSAPARGAQLDDVLRWHAEQHPDRVHIVLRRDDGTEQPITYGDLWQHAVGHAAGLRARGVSPGDNVALMLRTEPAFFAVFFAILLARAVPVPIYPPFRSSRIEEYLHRQVGILANAEARMLVTFREAVHAAHAVRRRVPTISAVVAADELALIKKAGRNLYPQEIEDSVGGVAGIRRGCVAAFGVADPSIGTERLIVIAETRATDRDAREQLRAAVVDRVVATLGLPPDTVVIADPGVVLKTSSGKVRRAATRAAYLTGTLVRRSAHGARWQRMRLMAEETRLVVIRAGVALAAAVFLLRAGAALLLMLPPLWIAVHTLSGRRLDAATRRWCRLILALAGCPLSVQGLESLPRGAAVFVANHASYLDAVALLAALPWDFRFVAKRELLTSPIVGAIIKKVGHLTVDRVDLSRSVNDAARATELLRGGTPLLFFPEGTFVRGRDLLPFRLGAFKAAVETGCSIIPVGIRGTRDILPADSACPRRGAIRVVIGAPLRPVGDEWREIVRLRDLSREVIERVTGEAG